jgi:thiol:disulfide interchange protein DsbC
LSSMIQRVLLALMCVVAVQAHAAEPPKGKVSAAEAQVRKGLEAVTAPGSIESIRKAGYGNFYEVLLTNGDIVYADETGGFFFGGPLIDTKTRQNVTQQRENELAKININDLPLSQAIKQVRGTGKRTLITFEDPNCIYCKRLAKDLTSLKDTTVYTFIIPILSPDSADKGKNIWCASDRSKVWNDWMVDGKVPPTVGDCDSNPISKNAQLAQKLRIKGTPTMFLVDGNRIGGYVALTELDKMINDAGDKKK